LDCFGDVAHLDFVALFEIGHDARNAQIARRHMRATEAFEGVEAIALYAMYKPMRLSDSIKNFLLPLLMCFPSTGRFPALS
jgi:hypothetical protein